MSPFGRRRKVDNVDPGVLDRLDSYWIHARHPDGRLIAAEIPELELGCGVWDATTGRLAWDPEARSVTWSRDGHKVARLAGENGERFELLTWPDRRPLADCRVTPWACCNERLALSPRGDLAAVLWWHQTEGGVELVSLAGGDARQLSGRGYMTNESNLVQGPTFSEDGRLIAISEGKPFWWAPSDDPEEPSEGGRFERGWLTVFDVDDGRVARVSVEENVPSRWRPEGWEERVELLGPPVFRSPTEIALRPEDGPEYVVQIPSLLA